MSERIEHKVIDPDVCPRCGGLNTVFSGNDGTPTSTYLCRDCQRKDERNCCYDIVQSDQISSVNWVVEDAEGNVVDVFEVYDSEWLVKQEAVNLLTASEETIEDLVALQTDCDNRWPWDKIKDAAESIRLRLLDKIARAKGEPT